jgi:hypothetical protein
VSPATTARFAFQAQPVIPSPLLTPADQFGGSVEPVAQKGDGRRRRHPGRHRVQKRLLDLEANRALGHLDPPRQRQRPVAEPDRQHENLMTLRDFRLVQDQGQRFAAAGLAFQNLPGERRHDRIGIDPGIGETAGDPLVAHVPLRVALYEAFPVKRFSDA